MVFEYYLSCTLSVFVNNWYEKCSCQKMMPDLFIDKSSSAALYSPHVEKNYEILWKHGHISRDPKKSCFNSIESINFYGCASLYPAPDIYKDYALKRIHETAKNWESYSCFIDMDGESVHVTSLKPKSEKLEADTLIFDQDSNVVR